MKLNLKDMRGGLSRKLCAPKLRFEDRLSSFGSVSLVTLPFGDVKVSESNGNGRTSTLAQNVLAAVVPVVVAILAGLYITQSQNVEALGRDNVKVQTLVAAELDLDKKIEADLANISSKYIDEQVAIQVLRGDVQVETDAITRLKDDLDRARQDHISDITDVRKRLEEVEKTFAPIRGSSNGH